MPLNIEALPGIRELRDHQEISADTALALRREIDAARARNELTTEVRDQLRELIRVWLENRRGITSDVNSELSRLRQTLEPSFWERTVATNVPAGVSAAGGIVNTGLDTFQSWIGPDKPTLQRVTLATVGAIGIYWAIYRPLKWLVNQITRPRDRASGRRTWRGKWGLLGAGAVSAFLVGSLAYLGGVVARWSGQSLPAGTDEQCLRTLAARSGILSPADVERLDLLSPQLRGRDLRIGSSTIRLIDANDNGNPAMHMRVGEKTYRIFRVGSLGATPTPTTPSFSQQLATGSSLRVVRGQVLFSMGNGDQVFYVQLREFEAALTQVQGRDNQPVALTVRTARGETQQIFLHFQNVFQAPGGAS